MKIVSWNVNGIRASVKKNFVEVINELDADIFCIQETKAQDDQVAEALEILDGYHVYSNSAVRKGYSGTAILSRTEPIMVRADIGIDLHDQEGRVLCATFEDFNLVNVYVPNSGSGLKRLDYRSEWDRAFGDYLADLRDEKPTIVLGDFNVAHEAIDLARPDDNYNKTSGYTQTEIDGLDYILDKGFVDIWRERNPGKVQYTFWSMRQRARPRNIGWRIDYFLLSSGLEDRVRDVVIHDQIEGSDHSPLTLELE